MTAPPPSSPSGTILSDESAANIIVALFQSEPELMTMSEAEAAAQSLLASPNWTRFDATPARRRSWYQPRHPE